MNTRLKLLAEYAADVPLWWEGTTDAGLANLLTLDLPQELILSLRVEQAL